MNIRALLIPLLLSLPTVAAAAPIADVTNTKHNLSSGGPGPVTSTDTDRICVFCHTPHGAADISGAPLWNRELSSTASYTLYTSDSLDATLEQPGGSSKLCLACHDGAMALGKVNVFNGTRDVTLTMQGTAADGTMPAGDGTATGYTRDLGTDLRNDHPISFTYDSALAGLDGELYDPAAVAHIDNRVPGVRPEVPLENDQVQCISCHDPHVRDSLGTDIKFMRLNRFQELAGPTEGNFSSEQDIICLACHDKTGWSGSAHANSHSDVANEIYTPDAAAQRDFPSGIAVWQAACLNCHDSHTVQGARRLLREGTDSPVTPKDGGNPALEETCYQCHDLSGGITNILETLDNKVPDIKTDFTTRAYRMPITSAEQLAGTEVHNITNSDLEEDNTLLGKGDLTNRHAECTDCHNPHRVIKNRLFNASPTLPDAAGTHEHNPATGSHSNVASGVLAGTTGVEPVYGATTWGSLPISYDLKSGYGGVGAGTAVSNGYVTREYQICLKCHSDYAWDTPPTTGPSIGLNGLTRYTDQAMEFQAPAVDKGEPGGNHRSWHPVIDNTGRTAAVRGMDATSFLAPWNNATGTNVGNQTMYCSDCHGSNTDLQTAEPIGGEDGNPWGPHGSNNPFLLKGTWDNETGAAGATDSGICFKCHDWNEYGNPNNNNPKLSGFRAPAAGAQCALNFDTTNLHIGHAGRIGANMECTWCHAAVPHGWKNKALLIDITTDSPSCNGAEPCTDAPYILEGYLGGGGAVNWQPSGQWTSADCGGRAWMNGAGGGGGGGNCANPQ